MQENVESVDLLTVQQAAKRLAIKPRTMWKYIYEEFVDSVLIGRNRRIHPAAIDDLIARNTIRARRGKRQ